MPPGTSGVEMRWWHSWVLVECHCGALHAMQKMDVRKAIRRGQNLYCGPRCMAQAFAVANRTRGCSECGGPIPRSRKETCSTECLRKRQAKSHREIGCPQCGLLFRPLSSRTTYCSRVCADSAHSVRMVGKGNSHFKTGMSYGHWFRSMRPLILERDGHECVVCHSNPVQTYLRKGRPVSRSSLVIHHINEDVTNNHPGNLITLCSTCHMVHHKSKQTPWPWFAEKAKTSSMSMTSRWKTLVTSLAAVYSSTTA